MKLQDNHEDMILSVVDLHSITLPQDPRTLSDNIMEMTATLLACGVDPSKVILFQQSMVPAHTHLTWCLGCICTMARYDGEGAPLSLTRFFKISAPTDV